MTSWTSSLSPIFTCLNVENRPSSTKMLKRTKRESDHCHRCTVIFNSFEGGSFIFVFYCIFVIQFSEVFWGGTWGASIPPPPPRVLRIRHKHLKWIKFEKNEIYYLSKLKKLSWKKSVVWMLSATLNVLLSAENICRKYFFRKCFSNRIKWCMKTRSIYVCSLLEYSGRKSYVIRIIKKMRLNRYIFFNQRWMICTFLRIKVMRQLICYFWGLVR